MTRKRIRVPVEPLSDDRVERLERRLLAERQREVMLAPVPDLRRGLRRLLLFTTMTVGVAAGAGLMWWKARSVAPVAVMAETPALQVAPLHLRTPPGATSRFDLGSAKLEVAGASDLTVETATDGTTTVVLAAGAVDCEVAPRLSRAPFRVVAADVVVTVVGTRFAVEHGESGGVNVRVVHGTVRVAGPGGIRAVSAGQAWDRDRPGDVVAIAAAEPGRADLPAPRTFTSGGAGPGDSPAPAGAGATSASATEPDAGAAAGELMAAAALEATAPERAAVRYEALSRGDGAPAEDATFRLAALELGRGRWDKAVAATVRYEQRFPRGSRLGDALWIRVQAHCGAYRSRAAEVAAASYVRRFPTGPYAARLAQGAVCRGE
jgi:hypothetical protein